ncbi:MAG: hypothetical protein ACE14O_03390 [Candidatus Cloacimonadaceae bacterium]
MRFENSRPQNQSVNLDNSIVIKDYPREIVRKFNTEFKVFSNIKNEQTKIYTERLNEIKRKYISSIPGRGNVYLLENKFRLENEIAQLNTFINQNKKKYFDSQYKEVDNSINSILKEITPNTLDSFRSSHHLNFFPDKHIREEIKQTLHKSLLSKINKIVENITVKYYFKDITYDDIKDSEFLNHLKNKFKIIDWNSFDPIHESITLQVKS